MTKEDVFFLNKKNTRISGRIYRADSVSETGVIFCHGLFSSKDGCKITALAEDIVIAGYTLLTFDFSFTGESGGNLSEMSVLQEVDDLRCAFRFFKEYGIKKIHLIGSSMGGVVTLLFASGRDYNPESLVLLATPIRLKELMHGISGIDDANSLNENGMTLVDGVFLNNFFFKELSEIDMLASVRGIDKPVLIIHGSRDEVVNASDAESLNRELRCDKKLFFIKDGDHSLTRDTDILFLKKTIIKWLNSH